MFVRLLSLFILILISAGVASWLMAQPGNLYVEWLGWLFVVLLIALYFLVR